MVSNILTTRGIRAQNKMISSDRGLKRSQLRSHSHQDVKVEFCQTLYLKMILLQPGAIWLCGLCMFYSHRSYWWLRQRWTCPSPKKRQKLFYIVYQLHVLSTLEFRLVSVWVCICALKNVVRHMNSEGEYALSPSHLQSAFWSGTGSLLYPSCLGDERICWWTRERFAGWRCL